MRLIVACFLLIGFSSCKSEMPSKHRTFKTIEIENLIQDSLINIRALEIDKKGFGTFALSNGKIGRILNNSINDSTHIAIQLEYDSIIPNFRALAITNKASFVLSIASPALLFKIENDSSKIVYKENHPKAFYDALDFWNDKEGIAIGDPINGCMSIIITRDGGDTWTKLACKDLPKSKDGEGAFAASDTNIALVGDHTWIATGGKASRVLYSPDKGNTWNVFDTPILQGKETRGIYSIDFYDQKMGFAIGGDYTKPNDTLNNKIRTEDGGKTWKVVANGKSPGYRSCVQYIPNSKGKELVAVGFKGIDYSNDFGESWKHLSDEGFYTIRFLNDSIAYAAGKGRISKLSFKIRP